MELPQHGISSNPEEELRFDGNVTVEKNESVSQKASNIFSLLRSSV